jgi:hypothetical protein
LLRYWIFGFVWLSAACSGEDDPPRVMPRPDGGETGGSGAEGGDVSSTGGSSSGRGGNAGTGGSGNTAGIGRPDPEEIYTFGSFETDRTDRLVLSHWTGPDYAAGFADVNTFQTTLGEQGLIYQVASRPSEIRLFVPDRVSSEPSSEYPADPMANDPLFAELECQPGGIIIDFVVGFSDRIVYRCTGDGGGWFQDGELLYAQEQDFTGDLLSLGGDVGFFIDQAADLGAYVVNLVTGARTRVLADIVLIDVGSVGAVRAISGGFYVATNRDLDPDPFGFDFVYELWEVGDDARERLVGTYDGASGLTWKLDTDGNVYGGGGEFLTRRMLGGGSEEIYGVDVPPDVDIHSLVTGP